MIPTEYGCTFCATKNCPSLGSKTMFPPCKGNDFTQRPIPPHEKKEQQANETNGDMLGFDDWYNLCKSGLTMYAFNSARIGMIPAKNAISLPDESEWPEDADYIDIVYRREDNTKLHRLLTVSRTKPQPIKMSKAEAMERLAGVMGKEVEIVG